MHKSLGHARKGAKVVCLAFAMAISAAAGAAEVSTMGSIPVPPKPKFTSPFDPASSVPTPPKPKIDSQASSNPVPPKPK
jgi:hypothetical protein